MHPYEFSVPYNSDRATLVELLRLARQNPGRIREVFLSGPEDAASSGRVARGMTPPEFEEIVGEIHGAGVRANLVMNTTCEGVAWYETRAQLRLRDYLEWAVLGLGVDSVTVANPLYIGLIRNWFPSLEICASVLSDVDCAERAKAVVAAGATVITPDVNVNRDLETLEAIRREGAKLKIMVNEGCLYKCPWRKFHFNAVSHIGKNAGRVGVSISPEDFVAQCTQVAYELFFDRCNAQEAGEPAALLKSGWIRPEDLPRYEGVSTYFKISGRTMPRNDVLLAVRAYMNGSYQGNLLDLMDSSLHSFSQRTGASIDNEALGRARFAEKVLSCGRTCATCGWCDQLAEQVVVRRAPGGR